MGAPRSSREVEGGRGHEQSPALVSKGGGWWWVPRARLERWRGGGRCEPSPVLVARGRGWWWDGQEAPGRGGRWTRPSFSWPSSLGDTAAIVVVVVPR